MKMRLVAIAVTTLLGSAGLMSSAQAASTSVSGGTINFVGQVVDAACAVTADSADQTVTLDQVRTVKLATAGQVAGQPKSFSIVLADCDITISQNAALTFNGQADSTIAGALANNAGAGAATNVALQLYGTNGAVLPLGEATTPVVLVNGTNTIPLSVDYVATAGAATAGNVTAIATFNVNYS